MAVLQRETTEYIFVGISGDPPSIGELAFLPAGERPAEEDWLKAALVESAQDPLWQEAQASGASGDYFLAMLIGDYGEQDPGSPDERTTLDPGDYQVWVRLTAEIERPVRIAPVALEVE